MLLCEPSKEAAVGPTPYTTGLCETGLPSGHLHTTDTQRVCHLSLSETGGAPQSSTSVHCRQPRGLGQQVLDRSQRVLSCRHNDTPNIE